ncbi:hypothetical protein THF5H11_10891 [Vibrio jasicida]|uniref:DUF1328 domain-containing protein n=1 Tax=Vibrio jasicida TaxID=766224 RepID=A0AAU9QJB9_9VIBR|nr:hypothetical protein THF5H11_10891 [Vibrio jasicida]CAH1564833.1 hypothetical protein THF1C08_130169 [Vibrio jasicida]CAH1573934.1 hypothetical protein THF1A12_120165 [Vibrio jasicida]
MPVALIPWLIGGAAVGGVGFATYSATKKVTYIALILLILFVVFKVAK